MLARVALAQPADLVVRDARVHPLDGPPTEAVAVRAGRIVYVGPNSGVGAFVGPGTRVLSLPGRMVLPAFHDCHVHPLEGGVELGRLLLESSATSPRVWLDQLAAYAREHPEKRWIVGGGWANPVFPEGNPSRKLLDAVVSDRPVYLVTADGHSAWLNSAALAAAGITRQTSDPPGGRIEREPDGTPGGTLRESALELVSAHLPPTTPEERQEGLRRALALAHGFGITTLHEAHARDEADLAAYAALEARGQLKARIIAGLPTEPGQGAGQVHGLLALRKRYLSRRLRPTAAKIFADGVIESRTAALLKPYRDGTSGLLNFPPEELTELVVALDRAGFQIHVHAIGDRAVRLTLDALEQARQSNGWRDARHHLAHLEIVHPEDLPRFASLEVGATIQPLWAQRDSYIRELSEPFLDAERNARLYPLAALARHARLAGGSDWSVSSLNPLQAIEVALTRRGPDEPAGEPWLPEQRLDLDTALRAYTVGGAHASFQENETGTLTVGKAGDLIVLERDLYLVEPSEIGSVKVLRTFFEGEEVYTASP
ncbi:amidohydrolase [bacterium CPR1]|nr:amidohydrolase [bacterium CPR1]